VRADVLATTLEMLQETGFAALTVEGVAARSGVHRTTIHRRWPSRAALVADAVLAVSAVQVAVPDTGSLRSDLRRLGREIRDAISTPLARAIISALAQPGASDEVAGVNRRFWEARFAATARIVERAIERGEIPKGVRPRFVMESLAGPIWFRVFVVAEPAEDRFVHRLVDAVISGLGEESKT
jgi:AcrR family transcriptional regulator